MMVQSLDPKSSTVLRMEYIIMRSVGSQGQVSSLNRPHKLHRVLD